MSEHALTPKSAETTAALDSTPYRLSWYAVPGFGGFELHSPWWVSGERLSDGARTIVAAVIASDENAAQEMIYACYDTRPDHIEFRFVTRSDELAVQRPLPPC